MKKNLSIVAGSALLLLTACQTADQKVPEISADFCNCFSDIEKNMSNQSKQIMEKAANTADPITTINSEMEKLSVEEQQAIRTEMTPIADMQNKNSLIGKCIADVEKKYGNTKTFDQKKLLQKIVTELESKKNCTVTAALMKIGLKAKESGNVQ